MHNVDSAGDRDEFSKNIWRRLSSCLLAVLGSQGIVAKCMIAMFLGTSIMHQNRSSVHCGEGNKKINLRIRKLALYYIVPILKTHHYSSWKAPSLCFGCILSIFAFCVAIVQRMCFAR